MQIFLRLLTVHVKLSLWNHWYATLHTVRVMLHLKYDYTVFFFSNIVIVMILTINRGERNRPWSSHNHTKTTELRHRTRDR